MSNNTKIFSEAIAEAKAIRETAMANAKLALEEAFAPRIQEMMSDKLEALAEEEMEEGYEKELDEELEEAGKENMDEISLEELLSELEGLEEGEKEEMEEGKEEIDEAKEEMEENTIAEAEDEDEVGEITVDELKDIIRDIMADVIGGGEEAGEEAEEEAGEEEVEGGEEMNAEDELELEEILAEIEGLEEGEKEEIDEAKEEIDEAKEEIDESKEKELEEAMNTIATLRSELNEVNLLNAKLLYVNKLFKAKNLNESQKVKVINAFDRAETVREAKNVYDTLNESLTTEKAKSQIKESLSFASKAAGVADRKPIVEGNDFVNRMQKLAGII